MDAVVLEASDKAKNRVGKISVVDPNLCIGCGVCAYKCPRGSIVSSNVTKSQSRLRTPGNSPVDSFAIWRIRFPDEGTSERGDERTQQLNQRPSFIAQELRILPGTRSRRSRHSRQHWDDCHPR